MEIPAEIKAKTLAQLPDLIERLRQDHAYTTEDDFDDSGRRLVFDCCTCGEEWPCAVAALLLAYDEHTKG